MLRARVFIFQLRHLLFRAVEHAAEFIGKTKIDSRAGDSRPAFQLNGQSFAQSIRRNTDFLQKRLRYAVALVEERRQNMLVGDFLMIKLRSDVLRGLERLLHFLGEPVNAHSSQSTTGSGEQTRVGVAFLAWKSFSQLRPCFFPRMSLADERGSKIDDSQCPSCFAAGSVPSLHHRLGDFRHGNMDASDDPRLGNGHAHDFGIYAWISPALRRVANAGPYDDWRLNG